MRTPPHSAAPATVDATYEFIPSLDLRRAGYGDRYGEAHRALEAQGKIKHRRETCPDRNGPPEIRWRNLTHNAYVRARPERFWKRLPHRDGRDWPRYGLQYWI